MASPPLNCKHEDEEGVCDYITTGPQPKNDLAFHLTNEHELELKEAWAMVKTWYPSQPRKTASTAKTERKGKRTEERAPGSGAQEPSSDKGPIDEISELRRILTNAGVGKVEAVVDAFKLGDLDDIPKLYRLVRKSGKDRAAADMAIEAWAAYRNVELDDGALSDWDKRFKGGKAATKAADLDDPKAQLKKLLSDRLKERLGDLKDRLEMAQLVRDAVNEGLIDDDDPDFAKYLPKKKKDDSKVSGNKDDELIEIEWPPDGASNTKTIKVTPERHAELMRKWNLAKEASGEDKKGGSNRNTVTWHNPYTGENVQVDPMELPKLQSVTENYYKGHKEGEKSPEITRLEEKLSETTKKQDILEDDNRKLRQFLSDKEKEDLNGQLAYQTAENEKRKKEIEELKNRDPAEEAEKGFAKFSAMAKRYNYEPTGGSVQDKVTLKRSEVQNETISTSLKTIASKVDKSKFGTGDLLSTGLNSATVKRLVDRFVDNRLGGGTGDGGGQIPPGATEEHYSEDDVQRLNAGLDSDPTLQQEMRPQQTVDSQDSTNIKHVGFPSKADKRGGQKGKKK